MAISHNKFVMFTKEDRKKIMKDYFKIISEKKPFKKYTKNELVNAARGMYIYNDLKNKSKNELYNAIKKSYTEKKYPIVHENSLTAWGNQAAEKYGLEIRDILKMKPGEKMKIIFMDRNVGEYLHNPIIGHKYDPLKKGFTYGTYTHAKDLTGKLEFDDGIKFENFQWEINAASLNDKCGCNDFWDEISSCINIKELNPKIKIGYRGPAIKYLDAKKLPKYYIHYGTWWDDYLPFRTHNFLTINRDDQRGGSKDYYYKYLKYKTKYNNKIIKYTCSKFKK
ncbi:MAG: hypothetical protein Satyrvirus15_15 [Satyrvirus sp.]|uniref:Uncharacterized protein n=1 Tax=Satyrvirus sp. TaxID=2487771 RepID=A0A3G5AE65_9VIRU|nr:MAG: hypothetical protein Satyrvirus15_15 [Satyrvirus sp.]